MILGQALCAACLEGWILFKRMMNTRFKQYPAVPISGTPDPFDY